MSVISRQEISKSITSKQIGQIADLKKLFSYYQDITETIREPFIILNKDLCVVTANNAFYRNFKVQKKDTENKLIYRLGDNQWDAPELRELLENILPKHRVLNNYEVTHEFPGIGHRTMLLNARQIDAKQLILLAIVDVTRQKQLLSDSFKISKGLTEQRDHLKSLNDAKDEFINMASHQLRTPATAVKQYIGMLTEGLMGNLSKNQLGMLKIAYKSNERQLEIIEDLLRVAQVDGGKVYLVKSSYNLTQQMEEVIRDQLAIANNRKQNIIFNKPRVAVSAHIDKKLMRMVLENLLDNAAKYSLGNEQITTSIAKKNKLIVITIKDNGVGIRKKDQSRLFQRFSRIENTLTVSVQGTGLGLYWVKKNSRVT